MFYITDYVVFFGMLLISVFIGIYFGFCGKSQTQDEYLLGGKKMSITPIALSLIAGHVSGITLLALPSDVYLYGANYLWMAVALLFISLLTCYVYLPVISKLQNASVFDYLDQRFNRTIRMLASFLFALQLLLYNPVVAYIPAIAFSQASGISVQLITPIVCLVCTFYTTIGGFKAVVWSDAFQFIAMIGSITAIFCLGIRSIGGFGNMFTKAIDGHRFDFDFSLDPTIREGFFPILLGGTVHWLYNVALQPPSVQKYISVSTLPKARRVSIILTIGLVLLKVFNVLVGIIMYVRYEKCDPLWTGEVTRADQILPYFVMDVARHVPGLPGLFIAGIFSAALSTLSTMFNTLSATIYNDFISGFLPVNVSERKTNYILKLIVIISGVVCTMLTFFIEKMGSLFHFVNASQGLIAGLFVGLFSLGMIYPIANVKGAISGVLASFFGVGTIVVMNQMYKLRGVINTFPKPTSIEDCYGANNITLAKNVAFEDQPFILFRLSHWYNAFMSVTVVTIIGLVVSWITMDDKVHINPDLISPVSMVLLKRNNAPNETTESNEMTTSHL
ncbi:hypothetical protein RI129_008854 [Pyrocoelia pectoralis]|uniref:Sodium-coupled monocarboxylate transporter 1 n=1 Tax=Pyrocoelia pectoralis TaxID=417401 RepID=A0AAN7V823_9COLE